MKDRPIYTRREFMRGSLLGGALSWSVPGFVQATLSSLHAEAASTTQARTGRHDPILVLLQLAGGNDGLNTVVPVGNDAYYKARPTISIAATDTLKLNDRFGLHPALTGFRSLYDEGLLGIVHGVGYPNPNRSHFRSTEIWQTAVDADRTSKHGWIGRYFDAQCSGEDATAGIAISSEEPQAFAAAKPKGVTFQNPETYREFGEEHQMNDGDGARMMAGGDTPGGGASIGSVSGRRANGQSPLDFLERVAMDAEVSSERILSIARSSPKRPVFPSTRLGRDLELVARLIAGGLSTRVYYVSHGGFDTHSNQLDNHERLLRELSDAVAAFVGDMRKQGNHERVLVMTFSEFGRRVAENGSHGTDHGTAAPLFFAGGRNFAGLQGVMPELTPGKLDRGDLRFTVDFRSVYATVLERHLATTAAPVLGRAFPLLPPHKV